MMQEPVGLEEVGRVVDPASLRYVRPLGIVLNLGLGTGRTTGNVEFGAQPGAVASVGDSPLASQFVAGRVDEEGRFRPHGNDARFEVEPLETRAFPEIVVEESRAPRRRSPEEAVLHKLWADERSGAAAETREVVETASEVFSVDPAEPVAPWTVEGAGPVPEGEPLLE